MGPGLLQVKERKKKKGETNVATGKPHHVENARGIEKGWDAVLCIFSKLMRNTGY